MKKLLCILFASLLVLSLTACGGNDNPDKDKPNPPSGDFDDILNGGEGIDLPIIDVEFN